MLTYPLRPLNPSIPYIHWSFSRASDGDHGLALAEMASKTPKMASTPTHRRAGSTKTHTQMFFPITYTQTRCMSSPTHRRAVCHHLHTDAHVVVPKVRGCQFFRVTYTQT